MNFSGEGLSVHRINKYVDVDFVDAEVCLDPFLGQTIEAGRWKMGLYTFYDTPEQLEFMRDLDELRVSWISDSNIDTSEVDNKLRKAEEMGCVGVDNFRRVFEEYKTIFEDC